MKTGEFWLAQLDPAMGSEIQKTRACVVISPDDTNAHLRTVIVAPMTTGSRPARFRVALTFQGKQGLIVLDQLRTLDKVRLVKRLGALRPVTLAASLQTERATSDRDSFEYRPSSISLSFRTTAFSVSSSAAWNFSIEKTLPILVKEACTSARIGSVVWRER